MRLDKVYIDGFKNLKQLEVDFDETKLTTVLIGQNGAGKSTFSRLISGGEEPSSGSVTMGRHTQIAFFSQTHADDLDPEKTVLECVEGAATRESAPMVRNLLGCFLFRGDDVHKRVGVLSGGERSRVALVCMLLHPANFLILDEPTNHLDIQHQLAILKTVQALPVTTLIAMHDLNQALSCDRLAILERGRLMALGKPLEVLTTQRLQSTFGVQAHYLTDPFDGAQILRMCV